MADDLERWSRKMANLVNDLTRRVDQLERHRQLHGRSTRGAASVSNQNEEADRVVQGIRAHHDSYASIITLIGYGGVFALWSSTAKSMLPIWVGIAGTLLAISLLVFVVYEMAKMLFTTNTLRRADEPNAVGIRRSPPAQLEFVKEESRKFDQRWHLRAFLWSAVPGVLGGLIVLVHYVLLIVQEAIAAAP
jgi:hypothetical protein